MKTEQIKTSEINIGDKISHHGVVFEITKLNRSGKDQFGVWYNFATKVIADNSNGFFPQNWQSDFAIQGNDSAKWNRIVGA